MRMAILKIVLLFTLLLILEAKDTFLQVYTNNRKFNFKVSLANFGYFKYGHRLTGRLQFGANLTDWGENVDKDRIPKSNPNGTQTEVDLEHQNITYSGCHKPYQQFNQEYVSVYGQPIYLVERGNCTFVKKANLASKFGKMLVIIDNSNEENVDNITMADDLSGQKIMIPVILISKKDGTLLKDFLIKELNDTSNSENNKVNLSILFNKPNEGERAEIQYWMIPAEKDSYSFLKNHTVFLNSLIDNRKATFEPHFVIFSCDATCQQTYQNNTIQTPEETQLQVKDFCLFDGDFCHPDPDGNGPLTGVQSLKQVVTEMCIREYFPQYFLTYFFGFHKCYVTDKYEFNSCAKKSEDYVLQIHEAAFKENFAYKIQECYKDGIIKNNTLLLKEQQLYTNLGLQFYPALFVNGDLFKGDLNLQEAAEEYICEGIEGAHDIEQCTKYLELPDDEDKWNDSFVQQVGSDYIYLTCAGLLVVFILGLFLYRRKIKMDIQQELNIQVDTAIQQYYSLQEQK